LMLGHVGAGRPAFDRLRLAATLVGTGAEGIHRGMMSHCLSTATMAERPGLGARVRDPLRQWFTRWDGRGVPAGVGGEDIPMTVRLFHLADVVEVHHRVRGVAGLSRLRVPAGAGTSTPHSWMRSAPRQLRWCPTMGTRRTATS
jgi:hypothetical protein